MIVLVACISLFISLNHGTQLSSANLSICSLTALSRLVARAAFSGEAHILPYENLLFF
jgi:hypothetical protein